MRTAIAAGLLVLVATPASAQWVHQKQESAFGGAAKHVAVTVRGTYGFGLRCQSDELTAILLAPEAITFDDAQRFKQLSPIMLLRIDNGEVLELDALVESSEGQLRVGAAIDVATAHNIAKARRRVAAALSLQGKQYHEHQFGVSGSGRAVGQMLKGCGLPQP